MTRKEAMRRTMQDDTLRALGFTQDEAESLRRISNTLQRWHELECGIDNGCVERDEKTNKTYWVSYSPGYSTQSRVATPDRETGARKRLSKILAERNYLRDDRLTAFIQTDPRGAALYILRPGDVPEGKDASAYYSRGICVY